MQVWLTRHIKFSKISFGKGVISTMEEELRMLGWLVLTICLKMWWEAVDVIVVVGVTFVVGWIAYATVVLLFGGLWGCPSCVYIHINFHTSKLKKPLFSFLFLFLLSNGQVSRKWRWHYEILQKINCKTMRVG